MTEAMPGDVTQQRRPRIAVNPIPYWSPLRKG